MYAGTQGTPLWPSMVCLSPTLSVLRSSVSYFPVVFFHTDMISYTYWEMWCTLMELWVMLGGRQHGQRTVLHERSARSVSFCARYCTHATHMQPTSPVSWHPCNPHPFHTLGCLPYKYRNMLKMVFKLMYTVVFQYTVCAWLDQACPRCTSRSHHASISSTRHAPVHTPFTAHCCNLSHHSFIVVGCY